MSDETEKVTVHRVEVMVVDHDGIGPGDVQAVLENTRYPNRCISPEVMSIESKEVDWHDQHPLNLRGRTKDAYRKLFGPGAQRALSIQELASRWQVDRKTLYKAIESGELPAFRIGEKLYRVSLDVVEKAERDGLPKP